MSYETEKLFRELQKYLDNIGPIDNDAEVEKHIADFMAMENDKIDSPLTARIAPEDSDKWDLLDEVMAEETEAGAKRKLKALLKKYPNFFEAEILLVSMQADSDEKLRKMEQLLEKEKVRLESDEATKDSEGDYYLIFETRPYMRLYSEYVNLLILLGKTKKAASHAEKMLHLSRNDNMGMRYNLMACYVALEDETKAKALYQKFKEASVLWLLPMAVLYYKLDDLATAEKYVAELVSVYPNFFRDYAAVQMDDDDEDFMGLGGYQLNTPSEIKEYMYLSTPYVFSLMGFVKWLDSVKSSMRLQAKSKKVVPMKKPRKK